MIYEKELKVKYSEMDYKLALKPSALLNFMQDLASENAENLGFGYSYIVQKNLGWFLLKYHIEFDKYPIGIYDLTIKTEPRGCNKLFAYRDFYVCEGENFLGKACSQWSLVDLTTKSLVPAKQSLNNENMPDFEKRETDMDFAKIKIPETFDITKEFEIRFDDLDVNQHVNNCNYIVWAFEPLNFDFRSLNKIKILDMQFKKEVKFGAKIVSQIKFLSENNTVHVIKNADTDEDLCILEVLWQKE